MIKKDWSALFSPGIHPVTTDELENLCLGNGCATSQRIELFGRLSVFLARLVETGLRAEMWIDGSFTTTNPNPSDIDVVVFLYHDSFAQMSHDARLAAGALLDRTNAAERWGLDLNTATYGDFNKTAHWRGVFGFCHDTVTPKGIAVIQLGAT